VCTFLPDACTLGPMEVGVRELRGRLSDYLARVRDGEEVVITDRGMAVARIVPITGGRSLDKAVADGLVSPAPERVRTRPNRRTASRGSVSDVVAEQRR
jgi:prevent-host-death family protein